MRSGGNMYVRGTGTTGLSEREAFARVVADVSNRNAVANGCGILASLLAFARSRSSGHDGIRTTVVPVRSFQSLTSHSLIRIPCDPVSNTRFARGTKHGHDGIRTRDHRISSQTGANRLG